MFARILYYVLDVVGLVRSVVLIGIVGLWCSLYFLSSPFAWNTNEGIQLFFAVVTALSVICSIFPPKQTPRVKGEWWFDGQEKKLWMKLRNVGYSTVVLGAKYDTALVMCGLGSRDKDGGAQIRIANIYYAGGDQEPWMLSVAHTNALEMMPNDVFYYYNPLDVSGKEVLGVSLITSDGSILKMSSRVCY